MEWMTTEYINKPSSVGIGDQQRVTKWIIIGARSQKMYVLRNIEACLRNYCCCGKDIGIK